MLLLLLELFELFLYAIFCGELGVVVVFKLKECLQAAKLLKKFPEKVFDRHFKLLLSICLCYQIVNF